jgi:Mn-dependent DtxR family transcriptional regulator
MKDYNNEASEKYLEAILILSKSKPVVRSIDIVEKLGRSKASVSTAVKKLREKQYITVTKEGFIFFTDTGREIAETIYERHEVLNKWLIGLGVDKKTAAEDAGRVKHYFSDESYEAIKKTFTRHH